MPIYEFYCRDCHTVFSFFSPGVDTQARPLCPRCSAVRLERKPSSFATLKRRGEEAPDPIQHLNDAGLEGAMESLMREVGDVGDNEEDPRKLGRLFRRFGEMAGLEMGPRMEEILQRLEGGEDPDELDQELEGELGEDDSIEEFFQLKRRAQASLRRKPLVDDTLYFLDSREES